MDTHEPLPPPTEEEVNRLHGRWFAAKAFCLLLWMVLILVWLYVVVRIQRPLHGLSRADWDISLYAGGAILGGLVISRLWRCPRCRRKLWWGLPFLPLFEKGMDHCPRCEYPLLG